MFLRHFLLILLACVFVIWGRENICKPVTLRNFDGLDCSKLGLEDVPQNLDPAITSLDLSFNKINQLNDNSFSRYSNLRYLDLSDNRIRTIAIHGLRSTLSNLEILHLSSNPLAKLPFFPETLKELYLQYLYTVFSEVSKTSGWSLKLDKQPYLRVLSLKSNDISLFPKIKGFETVLEELDLTQNRFPDFSVKDLAPLCQLKRLNVTEIGLFQQTNQYCTCLLVRNWIQEFNITVDKLVCKEQKIQCVNNSLENERQARNQCLLNAEKNNSLYIYAAIVAGVIIFLLILVIVLRRQCRRKRKLTASGKHIKADVRTNRIENIDEQAFV